MAAPSTRGRPSSPPVASGTGNDAAPAWWSGSGLHRLAPDGRGRRPYRPPQPPADGCMNVGRGTRTPEVFLVSNMIASQYLLPGDGGPAGRNCSPPSMQVMAWPLGAGRAGRCPRGLRRRPWLPVGIVGDLP